MAKEINPPITIVTGSGEQQTFVDTEALKTFATTERAFWEFLAQKTKGKKQFGSEVRWPIDRLSTVTATIADFEGGRTPVEELRNQVLATYSNERDKIPTSDSADARVLEIFAADLPDDAFIAAAATILRRWGGQHSAFTLNSYLQWTGFFAALNYRLGITPPAAQAQVKALEALREQHAATLAAEETKLRDIQAVWSTSLDNFQSHSSERWKTIDEANEVRKAKADEQFGSLLGIRQKELLEARAQWEATHNAFTEQLHLKAPKEYWEAKRLRHRKRAKLWGGIALVYGVFALVGMIVGIQFEYWEIRDLPADTPAAAYIVLAARGLLISIVAFWIARVLVRMFLSELHLGMDAFERSTMVSTYLALNHEGSVTPNERTLVLAPLFRPTSDGLVKDDASVDPTIFALFGKTPPKQA